MISKLIREPFVHFLVIGCAIFLLYGWFNRDTEHPEGYDIIISPDQQIKMAVQYQKNFGNLPDSVTMQNLIAAEIKNEIFYREALRLGLEDDDEIIRRRLKQKFEFLQKDMLSAKDPTEAELKTYYAANEDQYKTQTRYSFTHHYFSPDKRSDPLSDAEIFQSRGGEADPFHIPSPLHLQDMDDLRGAFGYQFAEEISKIEDVLQTYIVPSGFGIHLVKIIEMQSSESIPFEDAQAQVYQDYINKQRDQANEQSYQDLRGRYQVTVEAL